VHIADSRFTPAGTVAAKGSAVSRVRIETNNVGQVPYSTVSPCTWLLPIATPVDRASQRVVRLKPCLQTSVMCSV